MNPEEEVKGGNNEEDDGGIELVVEEPYNLLSRGLTNPKLLRKSAGGEKCCIFRISHKPKNKNYKAIYEPRVVSFGPYHYGKQHLQMIQEHKHRLLWFFMDEAMKNGVDTNGLIKSVSDLEEEIRDSYSESLYDGDDLLGRKKLIDMMVLDGCFILMIFLVLAGKVRHVERKKDPIFVMPWILPAIRSDLLLLENQVPFFCLKTILERSKIAPSSGLNEIAFKFFNYSLHKPDEFWFKHEKLEAKHLLDLIRKIFVPKIPKEEKQATYLLDLIRKICMPREEKEELEAMLKKGKQELHTMLKEGKQESDFMLDEEDSDYSRPFLYLIHSATKLRFMGLSFKVRKNAETLLDIRFKKNLLEIPPVILDDFITLIFYNAVAFEEVYVYCSKDIINYVAFMGCLLGNEDDARFLSSKGIIVNRTGSVDEALQFFKVISKDVYFDLSTGYLANLMEGVNEYSTQGFHSRWAVFKNTQLTYNSPRTMLSFCTGLTVLLLTGLQAAYTVYAYHRPQK